MINGKHKLSRVKKAALLGGDARRASTVTVTLTSVASGTSEPEHAGLAGRAGRPRKPVMTLANGSPVASGANPSGQEETHAERARSTSSGLTPAGMPAEQEVSSAEAQPAPGSSQADPVVAELATTGVAFMASKFGQCKWPLWTDIDHRSVHGLFYCGEPSGHRTYCPHHQAKNAGNGTQSERRAHELGAERRVA